MTSQTSPWIETIARVVKIPQAAFGLFIISLTVLSALLAPVIAPLEPEAMDFDYLLSGFSSQHLLGTDQLGRDTLSRLIYGARVALLVCVGSIGLGNRCFVIFIKFSWSYKETDLKIRCIVIFCFRCK